MKRIASLQDISCLGRCSLTVALPIISAMGVECAVVPTAVLSTHTMFSHFTAEDLSHQILPIARHWKSEKIHFDALYTGYLAGAEQVEKILTFFDLLQEKDTLIFVDPAMADHGKLYPAFEESFPLAMRKVVARADIALPNLTEACLLTGSSYREAYDEEYVKDLLRKIVKIGAKKAVLTGVSFREDQIGFMAYDPAREEFSSYFTLKEKETFHGTGDIFSSVTVGGLMRGMSLAESLRLAADYTRECIGLTAASADRTWYGVEFERAIPLLVEKVEEYDAQK